MLRKRLIFLVAVFALMAFTIPRDFNFYYQSGFKSIEQGNYAAAIYYLDSAIVLNPQADTAYSLIAHPYYELGQYEKAISYCNKALSMNEKNPFAWYVKGLASAMINVYSDSLFTVIKKHKKDSSWLANNIFNRYYFTDQGVGVFDNGKAIEYLSRSIALDSSYVWAYVHRAHFYYWLNQYELAEKDYTKCIELEPENPWHYLNRGNLYKRFGPPGFARDDYTRVIGLDSTISEAYYNRGMVYYDFFYDKEYACEDLRKAMLLGRYVEDLDKYCEVTEIDSVLRFYGGHPWRHDYQKCVCPNFEDLFDPETDTIKEIELLPGVKEKIIDIKDSQKTTWQLEDGRIIEISKKTKERWLKEAEEKRQKESMNAP